MRKSSHPKYPISVCCAGLMLLFGSCHSGQGSGDQAITVLVLGDSITQGVRESVGKEHTYPMILEDLLHEADIGAEVTNWLIEEPFIVSVRLRLEELDEMFENGDVIAVDERLYQKPRL